MRSAPAALLAAARERCAGPLALLPLDGRHAEALAAPGAQAAVATAECVHEGVLELMHML